MVNFVSSLIAAAANLPDWIPEVFPVLRVILLVLTVLGCIAIVVLAMVSPAGKNNGNVITGGEESDTYYSRNKKSMNEGLIKKLMVIISIAVAVVIVLFYVTVMVYAGI